MFNGDKLAGAMAEKRCSVEKMSNALGINPATFYRKRTGESEFTRNEIQIIAHTLDLTTEEIRNIFFAD